MNILPAGKHRLQMDLAEIGFPDVPCLGVYDLEFTREGMPNHVHTGILEACYIVHGEQVYHAGGRDYRLRGNDVFVTFPGEPHGTGRNPFGKGLLYWLQVALPRQKRSLLGLTPDAAAPLVQALRTLPRRMFHGRQELQKLFERAVLLARAEESPIRRLALANVLHSWLLTLVDCAETSRRLPCSADIQRVLDAIKADLGATHSVPDMAHVAGISIPRLKAKFQRQVGIAPHEYLLRARVAVAENRLRQAKDTVTGVAMDLGFSSSQYFATVFKRFTNRRPTDLF